MMKRTRTIVVSLLMIFSMLFVQISPKLIYAADLPGDEEIVTIQDEAEPEVQVEEEQGEKLLLQSPEESITEEALPDEEALLDEGVFSDEEVITEASDPAVDEELASSIGHYILQHPLPVNVITGELVEFWIWTEGSGLTYQWQWTTTPDVESSWKNNTSGTYNKSAFSFTAKAAFDGRYYRCVVNQGKDDEEASEPARVTVAPLGIIKSPDPITVMAGQRAEFNVVAGGSGLTYQWQWAPGPNGPWTSNTGTGYNTPTFGFTAKTAYSGRFYHCVVRDNLGHEQTSAAAQITVKSDGPPEITVQPEDVSVNNGQKIAFHVEAIGNGLTYQWQWSTSANGKFTNNTGTGYNTNTFGFNAKPIFNGRYYRCQITDKSGRVSTSRAALVTVKSNGDPVITLQPEEQTVLDGEKANFHVEAKGTGLTYQWQWASSMDGAYTNNSGKGYNTDTFSFTVKPAFSGRYYRCIVGDAAGHLIYTEPAKVTVTTQPLIIFAQPKDLEIEEGMPAQFRVTAVGKNLTYQWQWANSKNGPWTNNTGTGYNTNTFGFTAKPAFSGRYYRCQIKDGYGTEKFTNPAQIIVTEPTPCEIVSQPKDVKVKPGERVNFNVLAAGQGLTYQWQWSNSLEGPYTNNTGTGYNTDTFGFTAKEFFDGRYYRCIVTDAFGNKAYSNPAKVTVRDDSLTFDGLEHTLNLWDGSWFEILPEAENIKVVSLNEDIVTVMPAEEQENAFIIEAVGKVTTKLRATATGKDTTDFEITVIADLEIRPADPEGGKYMPGDEVSFFLFGYEDPTAEATLTVTGPDGKIVPSLSAWGNSIDSYYFQADTAGIYQVSVTWGSQMASLGITVHPEDPDADLVWNWSGGSSGDYWVGQDENPFILHNVSEGETPKFYYDQKKVLITVTDAAKHRYNFKPLAAGENVAISVICGTKLLRQTVNIYEEEPEEVLVLRGPQTNLQAGKTCHYYAEGTMGSPLQFFVLNTGSGQISDQALIESVDDAGCDIRFYGAGSYTIVAQDQNDKGRDARLYVYVYPASSLELHFADDSEGYAAVGEEIRLEAFNYCCNPANLVWTIESGEDSVVSLVTTDGDSTVLKAVGKGDASIHVSDGRSTSYSASITVADYITAIFDLAGEGYFGEEDTGLSRMVVREYIGSPITGPSKMAYARAANKVFDHWEDLLGQRLDLYSTTVTGNMQSGRTYIPIWKDGYTITFDANGGHFRDGTSIKKNLLSEGECIGGYEPNMHGNPEMDGDSKVVFDGWSTNMQGTDRVSFEEMGMYLYTQGRTDTTYYAAWVKAEDLPEAPTPTNIKVDDDLILHFDVVEGFIYYVDIQGISDNNKHYTRTIYQEELVSGRFSLNLGELLYDNVPGRYTVRVAAGANEYLAEHYLEFDPLTRYQDTSFDYPGGTRLTTPTNLSWDGTIARWEVPEEEKHHISGYQLSLNLENSGLTPREWYTTDTSVDLSDVIMTAYPGGYSGSWTFTVRSVSRHLLFETSDISGKSPAKTFSEDLQYRAPCVTVSGVKWEGDKAVWDYSANASKYRLVLYEDQENIDRCISVDVSGYECDFRPYMQAGHRYLYTITPLGNGSKYKDGSTTKSAWNLNHKEVAPLLTTPANLHFEGTTAVWDAPENEAEATFGWFVDVYKDGVHVNSHECHTNRYNLYDFMLENTDSQSSDWTFFVQAMSNDPLEYEWSEVAGRSPALTITAADLSGQTQLASPKNVLWVASSGNYVATWLAVTNASKYLVRLYEDGAVATCRSFVTTNRNMNLTSYMKTGCTYKFSVTAIGDGVSYQDSAEVMSAKKLA